MPTTFPSAVDNFTSPTAADKLNGALNPAVIHHLQHENHNDAVSAVESKLGINFSANPNTIDFALQILESTDMNHPLGGYKEVAYISNIFPSVVTWYTDSSKTITLLQKQLVYGPGNKKFVTQIIRTLYDGTVSNIVKRTITDTITLSGPKEVSRARVVS